METLEKQLEEEKQRVHIGESQRGAASGRDRGGGSAGIHASPVVSLRPVVPLQLPGVTWKERGVALLL